MIGNKNVNHYKFQFLMAIYWKEFYLSKFKLEIGNNMDFQLILYQLITEYLSLIVEDGH